MYGKHVMLNLGPEIGIVSVFVLCLPTTPPLELKQRAKDILRARLEEC
jgi:hypothetical protein